MSDRPRYPIRFPWVYDRRKRQWRIDETGLWGARKCAAGMVTVADSYRQSWQREAGRIGRLTPLFTAMHKLHMRQSALWARVFAGHFETSDPRFADAGAKLNVLRDQLAKEMEAVSL